MSSNHIIVDHLTVKYHHQIALNDVSFTVKKNIIFGIIGPANAGKTTLLKCLNRTIDAEPGAKCSGSLRINDTDVFHNSCDVIQLRHQIGMVFPLPVGLPLSVYENVAMAPRLQGIFDKQALDEVVERSLRQAMLWDEVKDRLSQLGTRLSGGQQQRLTLARAFSQNPKILCLDEFSIAIDPVTTMKIEDILHEIKSRMTIILVTSQVQQARRLADFTTFMSRGHLIESGLTEKIYENPSHEMTRRYVCGEFG